MEPKSFGRKLGIGMRVAGDIAKSRAQEAARRAESQRAAMPSAVAAPIQAAAELKDRGRALGQGLGRGTKSFGKSFFGPMAHAGSVLWLEITGCFFALFAAFFAQNVYQMRHQYAVGPQHRKFVLYALLMVMFVYFSGSSFVRARMRARRQKAAQ